MPNISTQEATFEIQVQDEGPCMRLTLRGQLDADAAAGLHRAAVEVAAAGKTVAIDWSGVEHLGGIALQVLLALGVEVSAAGGKVMVVADEPGVRAWLNMAGVSERFPVERQTA